MQVELEANIRDVVHGELQAHVQGICTDFQQLEYEVTLCRMVGTVHLSTHIELHLACPSRTAAVLKAHSNTIPITRFHLAYQIVVPPAPRYVDMRQAASVPALCFPKINA